MPPFYLPDGDGFIATPLTRGPWDARFEHGGPPSALLLRALSQAVAAVSPVAMAPARLSCEFLRPVPMDRLRVEVDPPAGGRSVLRASARLVADRVVMSATALFIRVDQAVPADPTWRGGESEPWPAPETLPPFVFPFFSADEGAYHRAVDIRLLDPPWGGTPARCWARPTATLVGDEACSPEEAVVVLADAESGIGPPADPYRTTYLNPDLTVYFLRRPTPGWIGMDIESRVGDGGVGLAESALRDERGIFGRSAQSLLLAGR